MSWCGENNLVLNVSKSSLLTSVKLIHNPPLLSNITEEEVVESNTFQECTETLSCVGQTPPPHSTEEPWRAS